MGAVSRFTLISVLMLTTVGCAVDMSERNRHYGAGEPQAELHYGLRQIHIVEPFESRQEASAALSQHIEQFHAAGCEIASAERWYEISERDGDDLRGIRIAADCPQSAQIFDAE